MERVQEYLNQIKVPFEEEQTDGMTVFRLKYCEDLLAICPPDDGEEEFHVVSAYGGKVRQYTKMSFEKLKQWIYDVFIKQSPDYVYEDEPAQEETQDG